MALESIALIPSGYKATKVYSQLPVNGNGDFTFDRGTSADQTRVNKNGLIESVAQDVPRLDYLDGGCPSLLLEPASTNLITYSEEFDNAAWSKTGGGTGLAPVVIANQGLSPDGSVNADRVQFDLSGGVSSSDFSLLLETISVTSGATTTKSVYLKSNDGSTYDLIIYDGQAAGAFTQISVTNDWQRFDITDSVPSTSSQFFIGLRNVGSVLTSDTADILVWGAQLEEKSYATSYVRSLGSQGQRNAETCNGAGTTAEINSQEGVLFAEIRALADDGTDRSITLNNNSILEFLRLRYSTTSNQIQATLTTGGVTTIILSHTLVDVKNYSKIAYKYKDGDLGLYINGLLVASSSGSVPFPSDTLVDLDFDRFGANFFYGRVKKLSVYKDTTQDLEQLTGFTSFAEMSSYLSYS